MNKPSIFISYSWETKDIADKIFDDLNVIGMTIIKDNQELKYTDSISNFMKRIRESNFALLLLSDKYLKSKNCLYEILELQKDENHWQKVLPIVWKETKIYSPIDRLKYIKYWEAEIEKLEIELKDLDPINCTELYKDLKLFKDITYNLDSFLKKISDSIHYTPEDIISKRYEPIISKVGIDLDAKALTDLLSIAAIENLELREIELDNYSRKNPDSSYYYSIKAGTSRDFRKFFQAVYYYEKGLEKDQFNFEILNNLAQVLEKVFKEYDKAKELYERAINANPNFDIPRLNLGVLLKSHFNDLNGAKLQYEKVLEFDPNNAKAHNNISSFYKTENPTNEDLIQAEFHLKKAIESDPNYIEALINYGNFLKVYRKKISEGNEFYQKAKDLDVNNQWSDILNILMNSAKG